MKQPVLTLHSMVKPELKKSLLLRGSVLAAMGGALLLFSGAMIPPAGLEVWGWPIVILSFGLIAVGLMPYRRLCRLESRPSKLLLTDDNEIIYLFNDRKRVTIPYEAVKKMEYLQNDGLYGVGIWIDLSASKKVVVHDPTFNYQSHQRVAKRRFGCDLFLPFFSERAFNQLKL